MVMILGVITHPPQRDTLLADRLGLDRYSGRTESAGTAP
jgi:hypothetical protein